MESWLSGLKRIPAKDVGRKLPRGFESLTLRSEYLLSADLGALIDKYK